MIKNSNTCGYLSYDNVSIESFDGTVGIQGSLLLMLLKLVAMKWLYLFDLCISKNTLVRF